MFILGICIFVKDNVTLVSSVVNIGTRTTCSNALVIRCCSADVLVVFCLVRKNISGRASMSLMSMPTFSIILVSVGTMASSIGQFMKLSPVLLIRSVLNVVFECLAFLVWCEHMQLRRIVVIDASVQVVKQAGPVTLEIGSLIMSRNNKVGTVTPTMNDLRMLTLLSWNGF